MKPVVALLLFPLLTALARASSSLLWFDAPAQHFTESAPLGNGRLGAMVFGGVEQERIVLNETGMWSGSPQEADRPNAAAVLPEIRRLLFSGKNVEAEELIAANFTCAGAGSGRGNGAKLPYGSYQVLGDLTFTRPPGGAPQPISNYRRELDLSTAIARTTYEQNGVTFVREVFVSAPDEAVVLKISANKPGAISGRLALTRPENATTTAVENDGLRLPVDVTGSTEGQFVCRTWAARTAFANSCR